MLLQAVSNIMSATVVSLCNWALIYNLEEYPIKLLRTTVIIIRTSNISFRDHICPTSSLCSSKCHGVSKWQGGKRDSGHPCFLLFLSNCLGSDPRYSPNLEPMQSREEAREQQVLSDENLSPWLFGNRWSVLQSHVRDSNICFPLFSCKLNTYYLVQHHAVSERSVP